MATAQKERAPFNRDVLQWARKRVRLSLDSAARGAGVTPDHIQRWEAGADVPTVKQARKLANVYDVPFMEFLSKERPKIKELELVPDFRLHSDVEAPNEQHELLLIQAEAEETRLNALDLYDILRIKPPVLDDSFYWALGKSPEAAAASVREVLKLPMSEQYSRKGNVKAKFISAFRNYLERAGIITMKNSGLAAFGARGMCLFASPLPVLVFSKEAPTAQAFTLAHELGHVVVKESGISGPIGTAPNKTRARQVEDWCDGFAGAFLMPKAEVVRVLYPVPRRPESGIDDTRIAAVANAFCVSRHAALVRLVELGYVEEEFYWRVKRPQFLQQERDFKGGGRPEYYGSRFRSSRGDLYTGLVLEAWSNGMITNHNAAEFMGIKNLAHLDDIRNHFRN
ncbi:XRE family transcriptional regulator [Bradyrhizobium pachyrhizi]|uniref:helix-turn-helix domain-containing protein n=1 Tax=Bradyrhizobium pachyrhizi TaxID=280333 RepID=UPI0024B1F866|nr:XRE family transcriptional regulator [Bradyrhizobium pachyrhizi]WFU56821.1 XRE family transcriptional regulator [Bradyrhizobium pachyrhizi]